MNAHRYSVGGRMAAITAATAGHVAAQIWNPAAARRIRVREIHCAITVAGVCNVAVRRSTARGTPGATVTPDLDNADERDTAPQSGALLDLAAFTVQPTLDTSDLWRWIIPSAVGAGVMYPCDFTVPPGTGLVVATPVATAFQISDFTFVFDD